MITNKNNTCASMIRGSNLVGSLKSTSRGNIDTEAALWILTLLGIAVYLYLLMGA